jgi:hypothetical protein
MEIVRKTDISYDDFVQNHLIPGIPLVFTNASKLWKANGVFTPDWFRANYADRTTAINNKEYTMKEVMDLVESSSVENPAPYPFLFNIPSDIPELMPYIEPVHLNYAQPNWIDSRLFKRGYWGNAVELFIGGPGGKFPYIHLDYYHLSAWVTQIYGEKRFTVFPRGQEHLLYPTLGNSWKSEVNLFEPDYDKYPLFKQATPISFTVGPGETLYIPFGVWHSAYSLTPTISVAFDQLSQKNAPHFIKDVWLLKKEHGKLKAALNTAYAAMSCVGCKIGDLTGVKR